MFEEKPETTPLLSADTTSETSNNPITNETKNFLGVIGAYLINTNDKNAPTLPPDLSDLHYQLPGNPEDLDIKITQKTEYKEKIKSGYGSLWAGEWEDNCYVGCLLGIVCCPIALPLYYCAYRVDKNRAQKNQRELSAYEDALEPLMHIETLPSLR